VLAVFGAARRPGIDLNYAHDWLIMPAAIQTGEPQWISFMARSLDIDFKEAFRVAYSTSDPDTVDFIRVSQKNTYVNSMWTRFTFDLPANAKYVAIEYMSANGRALLIDDISVGTGNCVFEFDESLNASETFVEKVAGYTVYRDGTPLTKSPVHANTYFDGNLPNGSYNYTVQATYNTSCVSPLSEIVTAKVNFQAPKNAPTNLKGTPKHDTVNLTWKEPVVVEEKSLSYVVSDAEDALGFTTASIYYVAQKWEASDMLGVYGYRIEAVNAFFLYTPDQLDLLIYQDDELVYEQTVTRMCEDMTISTFILDEPFVVDYSKSLTVGFRIDADAEMFTIAFDKGPAMTGGDLFSYNGISWQSGEYSLGVGNWYMAVLMSMPEPEGGYDTGFKGYLVYRDGEPVRKELISDTKYTDRGLEKGVHTYAVAAVYGNDEQVMSDNIKVVVTEVANEDLDENNLYIFPNPTSDFFTVYGSFANIEITDLQGKVQLKHEAAQGADVSVSSLTPGVYFVHISAEAGTTVRKLVVK
ncbi:MAG: T9SS type A sorting domain-containing protein, partial [Bacteroidales bacterium]|nr:T9SS type A sorting domain-containing protein [Bacteroidales bacterium]